MGRDRASRDRTSKANEEIHRRADRTSGVKNFFRIKDVQRGAIRIISRSRFEGNRFDSGERFLLINKHPGRRLERGDGFPIAELVLSINKAHVRTDPGELIRNKESVWIIHPGNDYKISGGKGVGETEAPRHPGRQSSGWRFGCPDLRERSPD